MEPGKSANKPFSWINGLVGAEVLSKYVDISVLLEVKSVYITAMKPVTPTRRLPNTCVATNAGAAINSSAPSDERPMVVAKRPPSATRLLANHGK
eukprot:jgi/Psemu1/38392/gm1.38392_g